MELSVRLRKSRTILDLIVTGRTKCRYAINSANQGPYLFFYLIQVVVHDADLASIQTYVEKSASPKKTVFTHQRTDFISQIMHFLAPLVRDFYTGRFLSCGQKGKPFIQIVFDFANGFDLVRIEIR